jgi:hypothetical protein
MTRSCTVRAQCARIMGRSVRGDFSNSFAIRKKLVDVTGFEPATPCLQNRNATFRKRLIFNHSIEKSKLSTSARPCRDVCKCGSLNVGSLQKSLQSSASNENGAMA